MILRFMIIDPSKRKVIEVDLQSSRFFEVQG